MTTFQAQGVYDPQLGSKISFGSDFNRARFSRFVKENNGIRLSIRPESPESRKMRGYFEGGLVPLATYYQDYLTLVVKGKEKQKRLDYHDPDDCALMRDVLKRGAGLVDLVVVAGELKEITKSSLGRVALRKATDFATDWLLQECGAPAEAIDPEKYKYYRDAIRPNPRAPATYIDYLRSVNILK